MNMLVELAKGEICCVWEDDDISLPHRAEQALLKLNTLNSEEYEEDRHFPMSDGSLSLVKIPKNRLIQFDFWEPRYWWYCQRGNPPKADRNGVGHTSSAFRRSVFLNKYADVTQHHDGIAQNWARANLKCNPEFLLEPSEISFIYRWGYSKCHISGSYPNTDKAYRDFPIGKPGNYRIEPKMLTNWEAVCREAANNKEVV